MDKLNNDYATDAEEILENSAVSDLAVEHSRTSCRIDDEGFYETMNSE